MKKFFIILALAGLFLFQGTFSGTMPPVAADEFPSKNIRWIVPYTPGGGFDTYSRAMVKVMKKYLPEKVNVIVINNPGAGGQVAASVLYHARPDGYTIAILAMPGLFIPQMFHKTNYDVKKITWLGTVLNEPMLFALANSSPLKTLEDVKKANVVRIAGTGFTGPESVAPITMETLGIKAKFITGHNSSQEAFLAAIRGDADGVVFSYGSTRAYVAANKFKGVFLIGTDKRSQEFPDVPTVVDLGYPQLEDLGTWRVLAAPPNLPKDRYDYLSDVLMKTMNDPEFMEWAKKSKRMITPLDGKTTTRKLMNAVKLYNEDFRDLLKKYIK